MIRLENVSFGYDKSDLIIRNLSVQIDAGVCTAVVGPNGGGKTTLGKLMSGILKPDTGTVWVDGLDTKKVELADLGKKIGYLFQDPERQLFAPTVREELSFIMELGGVGKETIDAEVNFRLQQLDIADIADAFPFRLSRGEKQRVALAAIMINRPAFFILDEPTTGLDFERKKRLSLEVERLRAEGTGLVVISHDREFVGRHAQRILSIAGGELCDDQAAGA